MSGPDFATVRQAVLAARSLDPGARADHLAALAQTDPDLHTAVRSLLAHDGTDAPVLDPERLGQHLHEALDAWHHEAPEVLGPYQIHDVIGEGGMGVVYRANQSEPLQRDVALKRMRRGIDSAAAIARFQAETQALAKLQHPHIAAVYDAGVDDSGRPYLVMELIEGVPITTWVRTHHASLAERLTLFLQVADAVRHAHQRGLIHRDLKPSNLLVAQVDGRPTAKVIDFGIAKATSDSPNDPTLTLVDQVVGTPAYMSPEQAGAFGGEVDTRTDVYALGVVLYELLTGVRPLAFPSALPEDIRSVLIREVPRAPSRATEADGVHRRQLQGDLDTIVLQALRKEPDRRYSSVEQLAEDLRRHLDGRPVLARGDSWSYCTGRFVRRHWTAVGLSATLVGSLAGFAGTLWVQAHQLEAQRNRAMDAEATAREEARTSEQVTQFLVELFDIADPNNSRGQAPTAREVLDLGVARLRDDPPEDPIVQARLLSSLGDTYLSLGDYDSAKPLLEQAVALQESVKGPDHPDVAETLEYLATVEHDQGDYQASIDHMERAAAIDRKVLGDVHATTARVLNGLAVSYDAIGQYARAEDLYRETLAIQRQVLGDEDPELAWSINTLAQARFRGGHWADASQLFQEALARLRRQPDPSPFDLGSVLNNVGGMRYRLDDLAGAEAVLTEAVQVFEATFGEEHAAVGRGLAALSDLVRERGDLEGAEQLVQRAQTILGATVGQNHPLYASTLARRALLRQAQQRFDAAFTDLDAADATYALTLPDTHLTRLAVARRRADLLDAAGRHDEAARLREAILMVWSDVSHPHHPDVARLRLEVALDALDAGDQAKARHLVTRAQPALAEVPEGHTLHHLSAGILGVLDGDTDVVRTAAVALTTRYAPNHPYVTALRTGIAKGRPQAP